jgi:membrane protein DedA with SNARE-associated domain
MTDPGILPWIEAHVGRGQSAVLQGVALATGTLVQEDLTTVAAAFLAGSGRISWTVAFVGCFLGIWIGDALLYLVARLLGRPLLDRPWVARWVDPAAIRRSEEWFQSRGTWLLVACRLVPGTRLPTFLAAGFLGWPFGRFLGITGLTVLIWTAGLLALAEALGRPLEAGLRSAGIPLWIAPLLLAGALLFPRRPIRRFLRGIATAVGRWTRWEFWPAWLFYAPVAVQYCRLALKHGGLMVPAAANPGILLGGLVGESKFQTLADLHLTSPDFTAEAWRIPNGPTQGRRESLRAVLEKHPVPFPFILKPDVGQRGAGVKLIRSLAEADAYLEQTGEALVLQRYVPGPHEVGIFYHRLPGEARGRIFAITEKVFPCVTGDGRRTLGELIDEDPRARFQSHRYRERFRSRLDEVLPEGRTLRLVEAGNHAQGCLFLDGAWILTPALETRIDAISRAVPGFFVGRYDIRFTDIDALQAGHRFQILELNGAAAEATSIYDPSTPLRRAYATLFRQWEIVFEIGAANRATGTPAASKRALLRAWWNCRRGLATVPVAD